MDKITQLLDIIEHPEKYSDEMLEKLFSDEQLSQYYEVMALASSAYHARRAKEHEPDDVDEAWKAFNRETQSVLAITSGGEVLPSSSASWCRDWPSLPYGHSGIRSPKQSL